MSTPFEPSVKQSECLQHRKYMVNATPATLSWYGQIFKAFQGCVTQQDYEGRIVQLREKGISPVSCNSWIIGLNAFLKWSNAGFKLNKLKSETKILATFSAEQITKVLDYKPKSKTLQRAQVLAALLLDSGLRIAEALALQWSDCDLDNLLIDVKLGKGRKQRKVPMSQDLRRRLYLWRRSADGPYVFSTRIGVQRKPLAIRNAQPDLGLLCRRAGITGVRTSPHTLRHSFAIHYLRGKGDLFYLSRILGHSNIQTTMRYLQSIQPEDLQARHISPLDPKGDNNR